MPRAKKTTATRSRKSQTAGKVNAEQFCKAFNQSRTDVVKQIETALKAATKEFNGLRSELKKAETAKRKLKNQRVVATKKSKKSPNAATKKQLTKIKSDYDKTVKLVDNVKAKIETAKTQVSELKETQQNFVKLNKVVDKFLKELDKKAAKKAAKAAKASKTKRRKKTTAKKAKKAEQPATLEIIPKAA